MNKFIELEDTSALGELRKTRGKLLFNDNIKYIDELDFAKIEEHHTASNNVTRAIQTLLKSKDGRYDLISKSYYDRIFPYVKKYSNSDVYFTLNLAIKEDYNYDSLKISMKTLENIKKEIAELTGEAIELQFYENGFTAGFVVSRKLLDETYEKVIEQLEKIKPEFLFLLTEHDRFGKYNVFQLNSIDLTFLENRLIPEDEIKIYKAIVKKQFPNIEEIQIKNKNQLEDVWAKILKEKESSKQPPRRMITGTHDMFNVDDEATYELIQSIAKQSRAANVSMVIATRPNTFLPVHILQEFQ